MHKLDLSIPVGAVLLSVAACKASDPAPAVETPDNEAITPDNETKAVSCTSIAPLSSVPS